MKTEKSIYLTDNFWKRTLGYCVVIICSFLLGCGTSVFLGNISFDQMLCYIKSNWIFICYIIVTAALFVLGYVSLYTQRRGNNGYKIFVVIDLVCFIAMVYYFLNHFKDNDVFSLLILYGTLSLSGMLFYYRLFGKQVEFVRYELLWPAIYTIALSAYMGYIMMLFFAGNESDISYFVPILTLLFYEYVLFLSEIPNADEETEIQEKNKGKIRIGFVHIIFLILILAGALFNDSCKIAVYFLLFCGASIILESLDVINRKTDEFSIEQYESAMCFAICFIFLAGSVIVALMERIPIEQAILLVIIFEAYSVIFFTIRGREHCTDGVIDFTKMGSFIIGIASIFVLFILPDIGIDFVGALKELINPSEAVAAIMAVIPTILTLVVGLYTKELKSWLSKIGKGFKNPIILWQSCKVDHLYLYLSVVNFIGQIVLAVSLWAQRKSDRAKAVSIFLFFLGILNSLFYLFCRSNKEITDEGKDIDKRQNSV